MSIELAEAKKSDVGQIESMMDDYLAELNAYRDSAVGADDAASYPYLDAYWSEPGRHPYLITSDGRIVGFALVRDPHSTGSPRHQVAEFFIEPGSRRLGLGALAAAAIWQRFPGPWELQMYVRNTAAVRFWKSCVEAVAGEAPQVREVQAPDGRHIQLYFRVAPPEAPDFT